MNMPQRGNLVPIDVEIEKLRLLTPKNWHFLGVFPWKLFHSSYLPIQRRCGFLKEIMPLIKIVHKTVLEFVLEPVLEPVLDPVLDHVLDHVLDPVLDPV